MSIARIVALLALIAVPLAAQSPQVLYQQALTAERSAGRLSEAIALYERAIAAAGSNRALAARALVRLGATYELLGRAEARAAYSRVLRDYADQRESAAQARERIALLDRPMVQSQGRNATLRAREVWRGREFSPPAAISPDGRFLTLTDWTTGDVMTRDLQRGETRRLTNKGSWDRSNAFAEMTRVSGDGQRVAYSWFTDSGAYELRVVSADGGAPMRVPLPVLDYVLPLDWMPAGDGVLAAVQVRNAEPVLAIVGLDGTLSPLAPVGWRWLTGAAVSPDGSWIVYDEADPGSGHRDIRIIAADGSRGAGLVTHPASDWHPMWTPDGRSVVFLSDRSGSWSVMIVDVRDGTAVGGVRVLKGDFGNARPLGFSRDGTFFYAPSTETTEIVVADVDLDSARLMRPAPVASTFVGRNRFPEWSPDGRTVAFISIRGTATGYPGERTLVTVDLIDGTQREFGSTLAYLMRARWSPDGKRFVVTGRRNVRDMQTRMYLFDPATGELADHPAPEEFGNFEWLPDGTAMLYTRSDTGRGSLRRFTFATGRDEVLYRAAGAGRIGSFAPSPDGQWIAFTAYEHQGTSRQVTTTKVMSADGAMIRDLPSALPGAYSLLNWSPDGKHVIGAAYHSTSAEREIWRVPVDGGAPVKLGFSSRTIIHLRLTRDGRRAVLVVDDPSQPAPSVWAVEGLVPPSTPR